MAEPIIGTVFDLAGEVRRFNEQTERNDMPERIIDDVFDRYERLETVDVAQVTEENISHLARLFKGVVDYSKDPLELEINKGERYTVRTFRVGDWIGNDGSSRSNPGHGGWEPAGTYYTREEVEQ